MITKKMKSFVIAMIDAKSKVLTDPRGFCGKITAVYRTRSLDFKTVSAGAVGPIWEVED